MKVESVPDEFNESLLTVIDKAPVDFPAHDLRSELHEVDRREKYDAYVSHVCAMERARIGLNVFAKPGGSDSPTLSVSDILHAGESKSLTKTRAWVNDLLKKLEKESNNLPTGMSCDLGEGEVIGGIITASSEKERAFRGSRLIKDGALASKWNKLLGSDVFPDLVMTRQLKASPVDAPLVHAFIEWYLRFHDATIHDNAISDWIVGSERDFNLIFSTIARIRAGLTAPPFAPPPPPSSKTVIFFRRLCVTFLSLCGNCAFA